MCCVPCSANLTWRDMQHLVVRTSQPAHLSADDWKTNGMGRRGRAGRRRLCCTRPHSSPLHPSLSAPLLRRRPLCCTVDSRFHCERRRIFSRHPVRFEEPSMAHCGTFLFSFSLPLPSLSISFFCSFLPVPSLFLSPAAVSLLFLSPSPLSLPLSFSQIGRASCRERV